MQIAKALQLALDATRFDGAPKAQAAYAACIGARLEVIDLLESMTLEITP